MFDISQFSGNRSSAGQYDSNSNALDVAGCVSFSIKNTGNVRAFLFGILPVEPMEFLEFKSPNGLPFSNDVNLEFANGSSGGLEIKQVTVIKFRPVSKSENEKGLL